MVWFARIIKVVSVIEWVINLVIVHVFVAEAEAIHVAVRIEGDHEMEKFLIESASQLVTNSIQGRIKSPSQIIYHVADIVNLARNINMSSLVIVIVSKFSS